MKTKKTEGVKTEPASFAEQLAAARNSLGIVPTLPSTKCAGCQGSGKGKHVDSICGKCGGQGRILISKERYDKAA